jgi:hypothetical protein
MMCVGRAMRLYVWLLAFAAMVFTGETACAQGSNTPDTSAQAAVPAKKVQSKTAPTKSQKIAAPAQAEAKAQPPNGQGANLSVPNAEVLLVLVRTSLIALDQANKTNNYTVLRDIGGPGMQRYSNAQLAELFANVRNSHIDLAVVSILTPQITQTPAITNEGLLSLVGNFPTQPLQIQFQTVFQPFAGQWRLFGLNVSAVQATAQVTAPVTPAENKPPETTSKKAKPAADTAPVSADAAAPSPAQSK